MSQQHSRRPCLGCPAWDAAGRYQTGVERACWTNAAGLISAGHKGLRSYSNVRAGFGLSRPVASATCLQGWGHAQRGSSGEEALVRAAWRCREVHLLGGRGWARAERGGAGWRGSGQVGWGWGRPGRGADPQPRAHWRRVLRHSPTLGTGDAAAGALPSRGVQSFGSQLRSSLAEEAGTEGRGRRRPASGRTGGSGSCRGRAGRLARALWAAPAGAPPSPGRPAPPRSRLRSASLAGPWPAGGVRRPSRRARCRTLSRIIPEAAEAVSAETLTFVRFLPFPLQHCLLLGAVPLLLTDL